eukprot:SAG31_NODE_3713_length_3957_cov_3.801452_2_plen_54_part_00
MHQGASHRAAAGRGHRELMVLYGCIIIHSRAAAARARAHARIPARRRTALHAP